MQVRIWVCVNRLVTYYYMKRNEYLCTCMCTCIYKCVYMWVYVYLRVCVYDFMQVAVCAFYMRIAVFAEINCNKVYTIWCPLWICIPLIQSFALLRTSWSGDHFGFVLSIPRASISSLKTSKYILLAKLNLNVRESECFEQSFLPVTLYKLKRKTKNVL